MSSEPRPKVGYIYTPPSNSNSYVSDIIEWVGYPQFDFDNVKNSFFKVAYIKEDIIQTSGLETVFHPTLHRILMSLQCQQMGFIIPNGWKKMCMYTDEEFATLPAIQKVVNPQDTMIPLSYSADPGDEDFMSAISSLSEGIWMGNNTTVFEAPPLAHPTSIGFGQLSLAPETLPASKPPAVAPHTYDGPALLLTTLIPLLMFITMPNVVEGRYISCDPQQFHISIKYTQEYLEKHFVATWQLLRPVVDGSNISMLDLFFDDYNEIPEQLLSTVCAMYIVMFRRHLVTNPGNLHTVEGTSKGAIKLNSWITTRDGTGGWLTDLRNALTLANSLKGPPGCPELE
ncbi:hypothetical protein DFJ58DRAFT_735607 [Suillus subalutaceus]|uniref:uncharacterized protein n=1 Tax=Suillus subalutaceus TaxID=48586 RepID=UPI001B875BB9|nr:uncharacterized protein DFJ58DRAFT_735607 [Suillus subalutaceus]KAG1835326.1 hypothetical protein DFJ58DRAFT_735607 [Suillus subalutaceus]